MPLNTDQSEYFELQFNKSLDHIMQDSARQLREADSLPTQEAPRRYADIAKSCAERLVNARIDAYIETVERLNVVPEKDDFLPLAEELHELARKLVDTFRYKMKSPQINQNPTWQNNYAQLLTAEIEQVVGHSVPRLKHFIDERNLLDRMSKPKRDAESKPMIERLLTPEQRLFLETYYHHEKNGHPVTENKVVAELTKTNKKFVRPQIPGAFYRKGLTILGRALLDPENILVKNTNTVIRGIRSILYDEPDVKSITSKRLAEVTGLRSAEVESALRELETFAGVFHHSGAMAENNGRSIMNLDRKAFDDYMKFESLGELLVDQENRVSESQLPRDGVSRGHTINVSGDFVQGNQVKARDNYGRIQSGSTLQSEQSKSKRRWSRSDKLTLIGILVAGLLALGAITLTFMVPEVRQKVCDKTGVLCAKPS